MNSLLTPEEAGLMLEFARRTIVTYLRGEEKVELPRDLPPRVNQRAGVFVALKRFVSDSSRESVTLISVGTPVPRSPLAEAVRDYSLNVAVRLQAHRMCSLSELESRVIIELSIANKLERVAVDDPRKYLDSFEVGGEGLLVELGFYSGAMVPQIAVERRWNGLEFITECCLMAGLLGEAWLRKDTKVYKFRVEVYGEKGPGRLEVEEVGL